MEKPTEEDVREFFRLNPQLIHALENVMLQRLLRERDAEIARLKDGNPAMAPITTMPDQKEASHA